MAKNRASKYFDSVVAYNDQTALYILQALEAEGIKCPDDVALTGFDNSSLAETCMVPLTTIAHPQEKLGSMAAKLLLKLMNGESMEGNNRIMIEPEIVERDSVGWLK